MNAVNKDRAIAIIQMLSGDDVESNLKQAATLLEDAAKHGACLAVLPEAFAYLSACETSQRDIAEADGDGPIQNFLSEQAQRLHLWIVGGTVPVRSSSGKLFSSCVLYNDSGSRVADYQKIHLFDVYVAETRESYGESDVFTAGDNAVVADSPVGRIGFSICYDLRFPELYRLLVDKKAEIIVAPSAFTAATGAAHWHTLLRARAIENTVYIVAANQGNRRENTRDYYGHSMAVDPWGEVLVELSDSADIAYTTPDLRHQQSIRREFPCLDHRAFRVTRS